MTYTKFSWFFYFISMADKQTLEKTKGKSRMNNLKSLAILGTQHTA
jgi:hypothetical protein